MQGNLSHCFAFGSEHGSIAGTCCWPCAAGRGAAVGGGRGGNSQRSWRPSPEAPPLAPPHAVSCGCTKSRKSVTRGVPFFVWVVAMSSALTFNRPSARAPAI